MISRNQASLFSPGNKTLPFHHFRRQTSINIPALRENKAACWAGKQAEQRACLSQACCPVVHPEVTSPDWLRLFSSTSQLGASVHPLGLFHRGQCSAFFDSEILDSPRLCPPTSAWTPYSSSYLCWQGFARDLPISKELERSWNESQI